MAERSRFDPRYCPAHQAIGRGDVVLVRVAVEVLKALAGLRGVSEPWSDPVQIMIEPRLDGSWDLICRKPSDQPLDTQEEPCP